MSFCDLIAGSNSKLVRGKSRRKNIECLIARNGGQKIFVPVFEQARTVVGPNASKVASLLGVQIRLQAPLQGVKNWDGISIGVRSSIIQAIKVILISLYAINKIMHNAYQLSIQ